MYEPESGHTDGDGFRQDVLAAMKPLGYTAMRYPGGNFASGYHWLDGIGPTGSLYSNMRAIDQCIAETTGSYPTIQGV